ncbi:MAG: SRPBCC family protein [Planctomycetia bacterium]|nr:SRPBCC family protein [Planctomycetia bacterium]
MTFACRANFRQPPEEIAAQILDLAKWPEFTGYAFLPGIRQAEFEVRTPEVVGTRIRVTNTDGSSHVEEIVEWVPDRRVQLRFGDFSPPLSRLATGFDETWLFRREGETTEVVREFALWPKSWFGRLVLWGIARVLERAVGRHLRQLVGGVSGADARGSESS